MAPTQIRNTYGFNAMGNDAHGNPIDGRGQVIGIVLWDSDATLQSDMTTFLKTYSYLEKMNGPTTKTPCTVSHTIHTTPCFEVHTPPGTKPPAMNASAKAEASLDVQWAHVTAESPSRARPAEARSSESSIQLWGDPRRRIERWPRIGTRASQASSLCHDAQRNLRCPRKRGEDNAFGCDGGYNRCGDRP